MNSSVLILFLIGKVIIGFCQIFVRFLNTLSALHSLIYLRINKLTKRCAPVYLCKHSSESHKRWATIIFYIKGYKRRYIQVEEHHRLVISTITIKEKLENNWSKIGLPTWTPWRLTGLDKNGTLTKFRSTYRENFLRFIHWTRLTSTNFDNFNVLFLIYLASILNISLKKFYVSL